MKKLVFGVCIIAILFFSCASSLDTNKGEAYNIPRGPYLEGNEPPITWKQPTASKDTLNITYRNISNESLLNVTFIVEYQNSDGLIRRFAARDSSPPRNNSSITSRWQLDGDINSSKPVRIIDIEVKFTGISRSSWQLSSSEPLEGDISMYLEKSLSDIFNGNLTFREAYRRDASGNLHYNLVSNVYLKEIREDGSRFILLYDNKGNELFSYNSSDFIQNYQIAENNDFRPEQQYRVKYTLLTFYNSALNISSRGPMYKVAVLESVEGLLSYKEIHSIARAESQRVAEETAAQKRAEAEAEASQRRQEAEAEAAQKKAEAEAEAAQKKAEAEAEAAQKKAEAEVAQKRAETEAERAYQQALASRDPDTIIRFLRSNALDPFSSDKRTEIRNEGLLEAAKIITHNNNIKIGNFDDSFVNSTLNPINPYAFDTTKVYELAIIQPQQFIDGKIIGIAVPGFPNATILLQNIPNIQNVSGSLREVFMRYTGITTLRLANGTTKEVPTFDVLYYYQF